MSESPSSVDVEAHIYVCFWFGLIKNDSRLAICGLEVGLKMVRGCARDLKMFSVAIPESDVQSWAKVSGTFHLLSVSGTASAST